MTADLATSQSSKATCARVLASVLADTHFLYLKTTALAASRAAGDEVTASLLIVRLAQQENQLWKMKSMLASCQDNSSAK